ncbi:hypothetical protein BG261_07275 [Floricoccus tropicus]|uniref:DUF2812 domain-containing protein n=1 Tax=Floricoccus tropicus TaxID=1859473 RepID=A0A1E8GKH0_9LACT|nr:DUF2812 domain-containing protein [Floricoccus tropicus]OFI48687.1 hypothetical protein BG261_07275 [Floricoccus tropicus]
MEKKVKKFFLFWQFDEEEKWLNDMSAQGWQLTEIKRIKYTFKSCQPNTYIYKLDYLDNSKEKNQEYLNSIQSFGIEKVYQTYNLLYLSMENENSSDQVFELFSDKQYRINFLNKLLKSSTMTISCFILNLLLVSSNTELMLAPYISTALIILIIIWLSGLSKINKKKNVLEKQLIN